MAAMVVVKSGVWLGKFGRRYCDSQVQQQQKKTSGPRALKMAYSDATEPASPASLRFHQLTIQRLLRKQEFQRQHDLIGVQEHQSQELFRFHETQSQEESDMSEIY